MNVLLTGATGYIGKRILPVLLSEGHHVTCCVRDIKRFETDLEDNSRMDVIEINFLDVETLARVPANIDVAYYLIHSMSSSVHEFEELERRSAENFVRAMSNTGVRQLIYLSGIINEEKLSKHLSSRKAVETILSSASFHLTTLRAGIVVGSGSASFEIIRDLVEKLPMMIAPRWLNTKSQPIAIRDVILFLTGVLDKKACFDRSFDIGGPEVLTYKEMLLKFAHIRKLRRRIIVVPVMTPKLSSYWLYFITAISYPLAVNLVNSMKVEIVCRDNELQRMLFLRLLTYDDAIRSAFQKIEQNHIVSSWTDAMSTRSLESGIYRLIQVPEHGCLTDQRRMSISDEEATLDRVFAIGGKTGWYYANWLWSARGFLDKLSGGVGLRRGRRDPVSLRAGETLDFWRVLYANRDRKRLLLYAEMKLPGEAWLEFRVEDGSLYQTASFRPKGLWGRVYWYAVMPFHAFVFKGMLRNISL